MRIAIFVVLFFLTAHDGFAQNENRQKSSVTSKSDSHPWLAAAPGEFVRLIEKGNVQIQVDDERIRRSGKAALTQFQFSLDFDFRYRTEWVQSGASTGVWKAKITSWMDQPKVIPMHTIYIPSSFQPINPWQSKLMQHEFDHVAVSTDPRLVKIIQRIVQRKKTWTESFEQPNRPSDNQIRDRIKQDVERTIKTCEAMIQSKYDELDKQSSDGLAAISNRKDFFADLYSIDGLSRAKFEYLDLVKSFVLDRLSSESTLKEVETHYLFLR